MSHEKLNVAAIQMVSKENVADNMRRAETLLKQAAAGGAELAVLPENFAVFNAKALYEWGEKERTGELSAQVAAWAKTYNLWIVAGTLPKRNRYPQQKEIVADKRVRTSCLVFSPAGDEVARYDKIHLFDVDVADAHGAYRESETIERGSEAVNVELSPASVNLGLTVCYDVRFPELYRLLSAQGAQIMTVPAAFTWETGRAHWESLLRARAIENQCFIIAANQGGQHSKTRKTWGHSMIIDPWGRILSSYHQGEAVVMASLDFAQQKELRRSMPVFEHRVLASAYPHPL